MALTHFNEEGRARMVDVSAKNITVRGRKDFHALRYA